MKKNLFKQIGAGLMIGLLFCWTMIGYSATVTVTPAGAQTNSLVASSAGYITQISLTATAGVAFVVSLYDAPALSLTNYTGQYTNYIPTVFTNTVANYTDILGNVITNTYLYISNVATTVGSSGKVTNNYRLLGTFAAPANTTVTIPYTTAFPFIFGLFATNNVGGSLTVNYQPLK